MKLMIASDIHGSLYYCEKLQKRYEKENAQRLVLLGDLLYHGPRNDLPPQYNPKEVLRILNTMKQEILCVRGNCDAEVDQMVLEFPILADYMLLLLDGHTVYATHGHLYHEQNLPPLQKGDILLHGHTHVPAMRSMGNCYYLNPGSASLPKEEHLPSYMIYEKHVFSICNMNGETLSQWTAP